jgi:hypothetical protein
MTRPMASSSSEAIPIIVNLFVIALRCIVVSSLFEPPKLELMSLACLSAYVL